MSKKPLPPPPVVIPPESRATPCHANVRFTLSPQPYISPEWFDAARRFRLVYDGRTEEIRKAITTWSKSPFVPIITAIARGDTGAAAAFLVAVTDLAAHSNDIGSRFSPILADMELEKSVEADVASISITSWENDRHIFEAAFKLWETDDTPKAKHLTKAQLDARSEGGRARAQLTREQIKTIVNEFSFIKNQTERRKGELVAGRCATGQWGHNKKLSVKIKRKDENPITGRYVRDIVKNYKSVYG